ncbi:2Fe-2S ferredoxin [Aneurinibacillus soli]|uniref:2Fe-2S ferredoxin-5 n=1 Tax=Aneurinibacillus soli TaxID=1500254 RepID=A0A0U5AYS9_9BACL|nr:2Fe-2S iron-sulfur cluster-binding protein [Aneurinibacillus soli]PYE63035.1 2Fe-2S ferredoxin [Aneurinibacillus soli]BAU28906.1 2Fe-2S ferredoxin-5 [Aneurinibacillus soli]
MAKVTFVPSGRSVEARQGETILRAASRARVPITQRCGGNGSCTMCKVRIDGDSKVSPPCEIEKRWISSAELARGVRLACQTKIQGTTRVSLPQSKLAAVVQAQLAEQRERREGQEKTQE